MSVRMQGHLGGALAHGQAEPGSAPAGRELRPMLARMRKSSRVLGFKEAWSKDSPLFCLNADAQLSDLAAETVRTTAALLGC